LWRINETDGSTAVVAGEGAYDDPMIRSGTLLASDGQRLYVSDLNISTGQAWMKSITIGLRPQLGGHAANPTMDYATLSGVRTQSPLPPTTAMAIVGSDIYTAVGGQIVGINRDTGKVTPVAGSATDQSDCDDLADSGADARFRDPHVLAADGHLIYVEDTYCGLNVVNIATGRTYRSIGVVYSLALNGRDMWQQQQFSSNDFNLMRYDRITGQTTSFGGFGGFGGSILATTSGLWSMSGSDLWRIDQTSKQGSVALSLPFTPSAVASAGDSVYAAGPAPCFRASPRWPRSATAWSSRPVSPEG
jgi:hypothetical protein